MILKRNITFMPERRKKDGVIQEENVPIRLRVNFGGGRIDFSTGYRIDVAKWDAVRQRVRNGCTNRAKQSSAEINADLNRMESILQDIFKGFEVRGETPSFAQVREAFNAAWNGDDAPGEAEADEPEGISFFAAFDEFLTEEARLSGWAQNTLKNFKSGKRHLEEYERSVGQPLTFDYFSEAGMTAYQEYLLGLDMKSSTIQKQIKYVKWFLKWALKKEYHSATRFQNFSPKLKSTDKKVIFLTDGELERLERYAIPASKRYLERVRDVFLFCCYSGLRYSDVANLRPGNIRENHIEVTTQKTSDNLLIDLNRHTRDILAKYADMHFKDGRALPVISNQRMNTYLQELCRLAGIDDIVRETAFVGNRKVVTETPKYELVTTHCGRRTFICKALSLGIPVQVVMKWTGHKDYKAMRPYIDIADSVKASAMSKFDKE